MQDLAQIVVVVAWGMLKMLVSAGFGIGFGFTFWETFIWTSFGGCLGVLLFYNLSERLSEWLRSRWIKKRVAAQSLGLPVKRIFTKRNRLLIKVKHASGLFGVAALTPLLLTIPIGSILAARFYHHDRRTIPALMISVVLQAMVVSAGLTGLIEGLKSFFEQFLR